MSAGISFEDGLELVRELWRVNGIATGNLQGPGQGGDPNLRALVNQMTIPGQRLSWYATQLQTATFSVLSEVELTYRKAWVHSTYPEISGDAKCDRFYLETLRQNCLKLLTKAAHDPEAKQMFDAYQRLCSLFETSMRSFRRGWNAKDVSTEVGFIRSYLQSKVAEHGLTGSVML